MCPLKSEQQPLNVQTIEVLIRSRGLAKMESWVPLGQYLDPLKRYQYWEVLRIRRTSIVEEEVDITNPEHVMLLGL